MPMAETNLMLGPRYPSLTDTHSLIHTYINRRSLTAISLSSPGSTTLGIGELVITGAAATPAPSALVLALVRVHLLDPG